MKSFTLIFFPFFILFFLTSVAVPNNSSEFSPKNSSNLLTFAPDVLLSFFEIERPREGSLLDRPSEEDLADKPLFERVEFLPNRHSH